MKKLRLLSSFLENPKQVGSIVPSSKYLSQTLVKLAVDNLTQTQTSAITEKVVIELGAGTGVVTKQILEAGIDPKNLIVFEMNPKCHHDLVKQFPELLVICGNATELVELLPKKFHGKVDLIISSLPLRNFPQELIKSLMESSFSITRAGAIFVQYTYSLTSPIIANDYGLTEQKLALVWRNIPPATIWLFRQKKLRAVV